MAWIYEIFLKKIVTLDIPVILTPHSGDIDPS